MKHILFSFVALAIVFFISLGSTEKPKVIFNEESSVAKILEALGDTPQPHKPDVTIPGVSAENGKRIIFDGVSTDVDGKKTARQSKHFVCTSCHNMEREDPDLSVSDPEARLAYAKENGLPFLQGTTLYGAVNRTQFYNGDYEKKYGDLVKAARNNLREAINLCAVECSQGRPLKAWEMESIVAYLWTIDLKINDLNLGKKDMDSITKSLNSERNKKQAIDLLKSRYLQASPATFLTPPEDRTEGYKEEGDAKNGQAIYELSCLHCHDKGKYSFLKLDDSKYSFKFLNKHMSRYTRYSIYQVGRYGTYPLNGKRAYMPHYTKEKMSDGQMEDLRAFIGQMAKGGM
jgi:mono/diheme cytochrome c family protein